MDSSSYRLIAERVNSVLERRIFFIAGAQKSGTTWLQRLLDAHPEILCSGEGHFADIVALQMRNVITKYGDYLDLVGTRVYDSRPYYHRPARNEFEFLVISLAACLWSQRDISEGIKCIGDKTPRNSAHMEMLQNIFPACRFVHIVRDGRDVLVSRVMHAQRVSRMVQGLNPDDYTFSRRTAEYAREWVFQVDAARKFAAAKKGVCHLVRYEDLLSQPEHELEKMFQFLEVDDSSGTINTCREAASFEKLSGGRKRGQESESFLRKGVTGDWKNHLDADTISKFEEVGGALLKELGYT